MRVFEFTLHLERPLDVSVAGLNRLYEAGCDDGSPGMVDGLAFIAFDREAESLEEAVRSAVADVHSAGYRVVRIETEETETIDRLNRQLAGA